MKTAKEILEESEKLLRPSERGQVMDLVFGILIKKAFKKLAQKKLCQKTKIKDED